MERYKISWRLCPEGTIKAKDLTPEEFDDLLDILTAQNTVADELWVFIAEPTNYCYEPLESIAKKCERFKLYAQSAHKRGLRIGVNPWPTFGSDEPRLADKYEREMPFQPMVGYDGTVSKRIACPIGAEFLAWSQERYRIFARSGADMVWVDDDCRITHLGQTPYPCFCPNCVKGFENGAFADRESLAAALNAPENGELRRKWCAWGAKRLATWCAAVREAVDEVDPAIETPFMSVGYSHTTFSGNYIEECMNALRAKGARPGHGFYWDEAPMGMFEKIMELSRQITDMPDAVRDDIQYEEESFPYAPLNKTADTRLLEMGLSIWGGCTGIAMNHMYHAGGKRPFDFLKRELQLLNANRGFFDRYLTFAKPLPQSGIWAAYTQWMMAGMKVEKNGWFNETDPDYNSLKCVNEWPGYGLPITCDPKHSYATLLQGKMAEVLTDAELEGIFQKPVLLDGAALECLWARGWGEKTGVRIKGSHVGGVEKLTDHPLNGAFADSTRTALFDVAYELEPICDGVEVLGLVHRPLGEPDEITLTKYGDVIVMGYDPYRFTGTPGHMALMRNLLQALGAPVYLEPADEYDHPRVNTWVRADANRAAVLLINSQTAPAQHFDVCFKGSAEKAVAIGLNGAEDVLPVRRENGFLKARVENMQPWEMKLVLFE